PGRASQTSQPREVSPVGLRLGFFWRFEDLGNASEATVVEQAAKCAQSEEAHADVLVPVQARAERRSRIVQVEGQDTREADSLRALVDRGLPSRRAPQVVSGGEEVAGVDADAESLRSRRAPHELSKLDERPAERVSRARRVLERDADAITGGSPGRLVERRGHTVQAEFDTSPHVPATVDHHTAESERLAALELVGEDIHCLS